MERHPGRTTPGGGDGKYAVTDAALPVDALLAALDRIDLALAGDAPESAVALVAAYDKDLRAFMDSDAGRALPPAQMRRLLERQQAISGQADLLRDRSRQQQSRLNIGGRAARAYLSQGRD